MSTAAAGAASFIAFGIGCCGVVGVLGFLTVGAYVVAIDKSIAAVRKLQARQREGLTHGR